MERLQEIIDLQKYPIHDLQSKERKEMVAHYKNELDEVGCCKIPNFIKQDSLDKMFKEVSTRREHIYWSDESHNPYFSVKDENYETNHPLNTFNERKNGYLNSDVLSDDSDLRFIYETDELKDFVSDCLGVKPIFQWADPLGRNPYNCMDPGHTLPWHFDSNEFTLSILVKKADEGGDFEYVPNLRAPSDNKFEDVKKVLSGDREKVRVLKLGEGDLQIFKGRFSMHRVTKIKGNTTRYIALPTYVLDGWRVNTPAHSKIVYGRAMPIHYERNKKRDDDLVD